MTDSAAETRAGLLAKRFKVLKPLYPSEEYNLSDLSEKAGIDKGNLSRYLDELEQSGLVEARSEDSHQGRDQRITGLSQRGRTLLTALIDPTEEKGAEYSLDKNYVERLMKLLESGDPMVSRLAAEELEIQTARWSPPDARGLTADLLDIIEEGGHSDLAFSLLKAVHNLLSQAEEASMNEVRQKIVNTTEKLLATTDARVRGLALRIVLSLQKGDTYGYLLDKYIQALREGSDLITDIRGALLSSHRERIPELRVTLLELYKDADKNLRERIEVELTQTRQ